MENSSSLTCILCNELVPAKEHTHDCKDEISVQIVKANLPKELPEHLKNVINNSENAFSFRKKCLFFKKKLPFPLEKMNFPLEINALSFRKNFLSL